MNSDDPTITEPMGAPKPFDKQICINEYIPIEGKPQAVIGKAFYKNI